MEMKIALEKTKEVDADGRMSMTDRNALNTPQVCTGLAFKLFLKARAFV